MLIKSQFYLKGLRFFKNGKFNEKILMEIYKNLNPASKEFEKLLNSQLSKVNIEEGKVIEGKINKITEKFVYLLRFKK